MRLHASENQTCLTLSENLLQLESNVSLRFLTFALKIT